MANNSPWPIIDSTIDLWALYNALELLDTKDPIGFACLVPRTYICIPEIGFQSLRS